MDPEDHTEHESLEKYGDWVVHTYDFEREEMEKLDYKGLSCLRVD